ncbi:hypothetical protein RIF29_40414 [Crotalaria pallida]|uniref:Reverse transcriptase zinc-binding domain-containing protein n=1 Tax=Crotalaria pallida TaxID=3830 RepID=A0AAN9HRN8_CROPI
MENHVITVEEIVNLRTSVVVPKVMEGDTAVEASNVVAVTVAGVTVGKDVDDADMITDQEENLENKLKALMTISPEKMEGSLRRQYGKGRFDVLANEGEDILAAENDFTHDRVSLSFAQPHEQPTALLNVDQQPKGSGPSHKEIRSKEYKEHMKAKGKEVLLQMKINEKTRKHVLEDYALQSYVPGPLSPLDESKLLADLVTPSGAWDVTQITGTTDSIGLSLTRDGWFCVASAYGSIANQWSNDKPRIWKKICTWTGPQWIRLLLWKIYNDALMTNKNRLRRNLTNNWTCMLCHEEDETVQHVFRGRRCGTSNTFPPTKLAYLLIHNQGFK